jgi:hypothetical protein
MATPFKFFEGFDYWASAADGVGKGWVITLFDEGSPGLSFPAGRYGGQSCNADAYPVRLAKPLPAQQTTIWMGVAISTDSNFGGVGDGEKSYIIAASCSGTIVCALGNSGVQSIQLTDSAGGTHAISGFTFPASGAWTYLELGLTAGATTETGQATVRQDGVSLGTFAISTTGSTNIYFDQINFYTLDCANSVGEIDDIYINNGAGLDPGFCGPMRVGVAILSADVGSGSAWTPASGTALFSQLNELPENGGTTHVSSSTDAALALFDVGSITGSLGTVVGVQPVIVAEGVNSTIAAQVISNSETVTTPFSSLTATYTGYAPTVLETDPSTGNRWTITAVQDATYGLLKGSP